MMGNAAMWPVGNSHFCSTGWAHQHKHAAVLAAPAGLIGVMRSTACQAAPHNLASLARNSHTLIKHEIPAHEEPSMRKRLHIALNATFRNVRLEAYSMINKPSTLWSQFCHTGAGKQ